MNVPMKPNDAQPRGGGKEATMNKEMMDKVSGGGEWNGIPEAEFNEIFMSITRSFGFDVAMQYFIDFTGYKTYLSAYGAERAGGASVRTGSVSDEEQMDIVLRNFWGMVDEGGGNGYH